MGEEKDTGQRASGPAVSTGGAAAKNSASSATTNQLKRSVQAAFDGERESLILVLFVR